MTNFRVLKNIVIAKTLLPKLKSNILVTTNTKQNNNWKQVPGFIFKPTLPYLLLPGKKYLLLNKNLVDINFYKLKFLNCYLDKQRFLFLKNFLNWKLKFFWLFQVQVFLQLLVNGKKSRSV